MCANPGDDRAGANPFVGGLVRIIIVESAAGGVGAVERLARGAAGGVGDGFVNLAVGDGGEGAGLVNDAGNAVREGGGLDAVEHHRTDRQTEPEEAEDEEGRPISSSVLASATPVAERPCFCWKALTASVVWEP